MVNVELVLQVVNAYNERVYEKIRFPKFLPIPFYHNTDRIQRRWYGPEDTQLLLTKNQYGEIEPIIIFNSYQRQIDKIENINVDTAVQTFFKIYRSMFIGWLFQYQKGKANANEILDLKSQNISYVKVKELRIQGWERQAIEKKIGLHLLTQMNGILILVEGIITYILFINGIILRYWNVNLLIL